VEGGYVRATKEDKCTPGTLSSYSGLARDCLAQGPIVGVVAYSQENSLRSNDA